MGKKNLDWVRSGSIGIQIIVSVIIGYLFGSWLDRQFETKLVLTVIFSLFGIAAGFVSLFREVAVINRQETQRQVEERHEREP